MILTLLAGASAFAVTPATLPGVIRNAPDGAVIHLKPENYGAVRIVNRNWKRPIVIDAGKARLSLSIVGASGIVLRGGTFVGEDYSLTGGYAILIRNSHDIAVQGVAITAARAGISIDRSTDVSVTRAAITGMLVDGIDIASSRRVQVTDSTCSDFKTTFNQPQHPDCVQMWSSAEYGTTQDVLLKGNRARGTMQGFSGFSHTQNGIYDGGFDRIVIQGNRAEVNYAHGVFVNSCRDCTIEGNIALTLPGARWPSWVRTRDCTRCRVEKNVDQAPPNSGRDDKIQD